MKLQFAFGNPRPGKSKKKKVAVKAKRRKTNKKSKLQTSVARMADVAKKRLKKSARKVSRKKSRKTKRNPIVFQARKNGKLIGGGKFKTDAEIAKASMSRFAKLKKEYEAAPMGSAKKAELRKRMAKAMKHDKAKAKDQAVAAKSAKDLQRYKEDGATINSRYVAEGAGVAKKKRKKTKKATAKKVRRKKAKKAKSSSKKRASKKRVKKSAARKAKRATKRASKKASRRRRRKKAAAAVVAAPKRAKRRSKRRSKRAKTYSHRHGRSTRHVKKGQSFRFKSSSGKGRRKVTVTGRFKINPFGRNPMSAIKAKAEKYAGMKVSEMGALAVGGALVPVINNYAAPYIIAGVQKIPGGQAVLDKIGAQTLASLIPVLVGAGVNAAAAHGLVKGKGADYAKLAGEGLVAAGIIGIAMNASQKLVVQGMLSGINFTPKSMAGINYTPMGIQPTLNGINYTPKAMAGADFGHMGDGYTEAHKFSRADFGRGADFGAPLAVDGGADYGDEMPSDDDIQDENMSGGMG